MKDFDKDIHINLILPRVKAMSGKQVLQILARETAKYLHTTPQSLMMHINKNNGLTESGIGGGVAMPHIQIRRADRPFTVLARLEKPITFNAPDNMPVDIACLLISPKADGPLHLRRLARLSRTFSNNEICEKIRHADRIEAIRAAVSGTEGWMIAA